MYLRLYTAREPRTQNPTATGEKHPSFLHTAFPYPYHTLNHSLSTLIHPPYHSLTPPPHPPRFPSFRKSSKTENFPGGDMRQPHEHRKWEEPMGERGRREAIYLEHLPVHGMCVCIPCCLGTMFLMIIFQLKGFIMLFYKISNTCAHTQPIFKYLFNDNQD